MSTVGPNILYRFGPYEVDTVCGELRKFGLRIRLERKPLQLLIRLLDRAGEVVARADLQNSLWGDEVFVDFDKGLSVALTKVRAVLSDSAENPKYIETVAGTGYRFIAKVEQITTVAPALIPSVPSADRIHVSIPAVETWQHWIWKRPALFALALMACLALLLIGALNLRRWERAQPEAAGKIMLVVLPFENLSGDLGQEYLSDGMTEELSTRLGNMNPQRLGVIGRTSAMAYRHSPKTIGQIGKELGVAYVLEGSVRHDVNKLRVTAQLVNVSDQTHIWAQDYDRDMHDLMTVEDEVASDIARQVGVSMALGISDKMLNQHVPNLQAHEEYLLARYYWYKRTPAGWAAAEHHFRSAIEKDSQYAAAYAGLAECASRQEALVAARKAVELDPASAEVQTALGWVEYFREWDFVAAARALKTAIQLDPNYAPAHHLYSAILGLTNRPDEAVAEEQQAVQLDPLALIFRAALAGHLSTAGRNDRAMEQIQQLFAIDPKYPKGHETLGEIYLSRRMYKEAVREFEACERYGGPRELASIGYAYARLGDKQAALKIRSELQDLEKRSPSGDVSADLALVEIGLGNRDASLGWLEKQYEQHDNDGPWDAKDDPLFAPLRSDPRFQELMRRVKYPS